jgi:hypothetical protein
MYLTKVQILSGKKEIRSNQLKALLTLPTHMPVFMRMR